MNITFKFCVLLLIPYLNITVQFKYYWVAAELWNNQMYIICHLSTTILKNPDLEIFGNGYWLASATSVDRVLISMNRFQPTVKIISGPYLFWIKTWDSEQCWDICYSRFPSKWLIQFHILFWPGPKNSVLTTLVETSAVVFSKARLKWDFNP